MCFLHIFQQQIIIKWALKKSQYGKDRTKSWVENTKNKGSYNDYLKQKKNAMTERSKKMRMELAFMNDDCREVLLQVRREKERKKKAEYCKKADKTNAAESISPLTVYKS